jgi:hypothetical protein
MKVNSQKVMAKKPALYHVRFGARFVKGLYLWSLISFCRHPLTTYKTGFVTLNPSTTFILGVQTPDERESSLPFSLIIGSLFF